MSLLFVGSENSAGNTSFHNSLPMNDVTLQPTSKAFSTTGFRHHDDHSSSHYQPGGNAEHNDFENRLGGHSRQRI